MSTATGQQTESETLTHNSTRPSPKHMADGHRARQIFMLRAHRPDLPVAAYHKPGDLVDLHRHIKDLGYADSDFDWHFGHYSDCIDDSIFYVLRKPATSV
jgi:hypothetical protein